MSKKYLFALPLLAIPMHASAALLWTVGTDDNGWPVGDGGGAFATFVQEAGTNALPGNPNNAEINQQSDDDYYFAGTYAIANTGYPAYTPIGIVAANEESAERAFAGTDNFLRYHFNFPLSVGVLDTLTVTFDANNLHEGQADSRYGAEIWFNGIKIMNEQIIRPAQYDVDYSASFTLDSLGLTSAVIGPGYDNIVELRGINYGGAGGGQWMGVDYVKMDVTPVPEPGSPVFIAASTAAGLTLLRRRRRA